MESSDGRRLSSPPASLRFKSKKFQNADGLSHSLEDEHKDATRTLFIGSLDSSIETSELRKIFERFGVIEEIDIKRYASNYNSYSAIKRKPYAFLRYANMEMAMDAKYAMNGTKLGNCLMPCKIGYGKKNITKIKNQHESLERQVSCKIYNFFLIYLGY